MEYDGKIVIGTELDTSGVDDGMKELNELIDNSDYGKKTKKVSIGGSAEMAKVKKEAKETNVAFEDIFESTQKVERQMKSYDAQIELVKTKIANLEKYGSGEEYETPFDIKKTNQQLELLYNQLDSLEQKKAKLEKTNISSILKDIGKGLDRTIKKVKNWVLGIFGVYSAYSMIRNAMNVISQNDEQLKADIDYMKNALAYTLEPVVRAIVNLAKQILLYVGYIIKAWTGKNIFEGANKSLKSANKNAKELNKTLTGFDEMNILNSNSTGGGGGVLPSFDLTAPEDVEVPAWLQWIADNGEFVTGIIGGLTSALVLMRLVGLNPLLSMGIGGAITGIIWLVKDIIDMINDPSWKNFITILGDVAVVIGGIMLAMGNWWGLLVIVIGAIVKYVAENWDKIKEILSKVGSWIYENIIKPVGDFFGKLWDKIKNGVSSVVSWIKEKFQPIKDFFSGLISKVVESFDKGKKNVTDGLGTVKNTFKNIINKIIDGLNKLIRGLNRIHFDMPDWLGGGHFGISIREIPRLARGGIVNNPGRGVMMGSYIAGENGAEAVLPLTDDTLQKLANMIPITVNLTNTMNGRVISRELKKVQNDSDFAFNR